MAIIALTASLDGLAEVCEKSASSVLVGPNVLIDRFVADGAAAIKSYKRSNLLGAPTLSEILNNQVHVLIREAVIPSRSGSACDSTRVGFSRAISILTGIAPEFTSDRASGTIEPSSYSRGPESLCSVNGNAMPVTLGEVAVSHKCLSLLGS
jgi:hypothetical protein